MSKKCVLVGLSTSIADIQPPIDWSKCTLCQQQTRERREALVDPTKSLRCDRVILKDGVGVFCGMRNAEFRSRIFCGNFDAECSANYTLLEFRIPQSAKYSSPQRRQDDGTDDGTAGEVILLL